MFIKKIHISNYRNIVEEKVEFSSKLNCICGDNGQGKTNLLDAIHYLSMTKSFVQSSDAFVKNFDADQMSVVGQFEGLADDVVDKIVIALPKDSSKVIKKNDKTYNRMIDHIGRYPLVCVSPFDTALVQESGEERRRFLNMLLSQIDRDYLVDLQAYNKLLAQRNKLLKSENSSRLLLEVVSEQISPIGDRIAKKRVELVVRLAEYLGHYYSLVSGSNEKVLMEYKSELTTDGVAMADLLKNSLQKDLIVGHTTSGIHRDDLSLSISLKIGEEITWTSLRKCGSQGQQKSFLVALKLSQFAIMREIYGGPPMLLLDDVFDKLDSKRVENLIDIVSTEDFGQIFITDSNKVRLDALVSHKKVDNLFFTVKEGKIALEGGDNA